MASTVPAEDNVRVLFVCTANDPLPFAAAVAQRWATEHGMPITVGSAGSMEPDQPADEEMTGVANALGLDLSTHRSRRIGPRICTAPT